MRLARVISAHDQRNPALDQLIETAELDVLQLDYVWPNACPAGPMYADGLLRQMRTLNKTLYLDPNLHLITNAGGGNPRGCVEDVGQFLCEHGDAELLLTAIRGDNVLPHLEELMAEGVELKDLATGITLHELTQPVVAAQVELGAGPLAMAWEEDSRLVVAGCYDLAAPMIATAASALLWSWEQTNELAQLAVAAHLPQTLITIDQDHGPIIRAQAGAKLDAQQLRQRLLETADDEGYIRHADVKCQVDDFELQQKSPDAFVIAGVNGCATSGEWLLRLTYQDGYFAEALLNCRGDRVTGEIAEEMLRTLLRVEANTLRTVQIKTLFFAEEDIPAMIRVRCRSPLPEPCQEFVRDIKNVMVQSAIPGCDLMCVSADSQQMTAQIACHIPRDAIAVSVDTRPAKEWR